MQCVRCYAYNGEVCRCHEKAGVVLGGATIPGHSSETCELVNR